MMYVKIDVACIPALQVFLKFCTSYKMYKNLHTMYKV